MGNTENRYWHEQFPRARDFEHLAKTFQLIRMHPCCLTIQNQGCLLTWANSSSWDTCSVLGCNLVAKLVSFTTHPSQYSYQHLPKRELRAFECIMRSARDGDSDELGIISLVVIHRVCGPWTASWMLWGALVPNIVDHATFCIRLLKSYKDAISRGN